MACDVEVTSQEGDVADLMELATQLYDAGVHARPIDAFSHGDPEFDTDTGYLIQDHLLDLRHARGEVLIGAKLGIVSRAMQGEMGIDEPVSGWLTDAMLLEPNETVQLADFSQPRVEPEIALILDHDLDDPTTTTDDVLAATSAALPALEVLDCRFVDYRGSAADLVADNSAAARFALGPRPIEIDRSDLRTLGCVFERNGELVATAAGAELLGHPAAAVAWLVRRIAARGRGLEAGMIVLTGALTCWVTVQPGDVVTAHFNQLGSVELRCA